MSESHKYRDCCVAKAITSMMAATKARRIFESLEEDHPKKVAEFDEATQALLEDTIRTAIGYGYPLMTVAIAAEMTVERVHEIVDGPPAA